MAKAFAYLRTSSQTNVGEDKDSSKRQLAAINECAKRLGFTIEAIYYDEGVSGSVPIMDREGFRTLMFDVERKNVKAVLIESPDRFARDLVVQILGHDLLLQHGITLIPASAPEFFTEDTPTATMVRQILGAVAEFEKSSLVAKLRVARDRASRRKGERVEGRRADPMAVVKAVELVRKRPDIGLRELSKRLAANNLYGPSGKPYSTSSARFLKARAEKLVERTEA